MSGWTVCKKTHKLLTKLFTKKDSAFRVRERSPLIITVKSILTGQLCVIFIWPVLMFIHLD